MSLGFHLSSCSVSSCTLRYYYYLILYKNLSPYFHIENIFLWSYVIFYIMCYANFNSTLNITHDVLIDSGFNCCSLTSFCLLYFSFLKGKKKVYIPFFIIVARSSKLTSLNLFFFTQELFWLYPPRICQKVVRRWIRDTIISFPDLSNNFQCYTFLRSVFWFFILQIQQFSMRDALIAYCVVVKVPTQVENTSTGMSHFTCLNLYFHITYSL